MRVLAISGSLRSGSYNTELLRAAQELAPDGVELELYDGLAALPPYDQDVQDSAPAPVQELRERIASADALLIATPEYNGSIPGVLKNAIDWASRPPLASPLARKPVAITGASTGLGGTARAQQQLRDALEFPGAIVVEEPEVLVREAFMRFDEDGELADEEARAEIAALLEALVEATEGVTLAA